MAPVWIHLYPAHLGWMNVLDRRGERILVHSGQPVAMGFTPRFDGRVFGAATLNGLIGLPHAPYTQCMV